MSKIKKSDFLERVDLGVRRGAARVLTAHKEAGRSIYVWKDGKVVEIPPEEIKINEKYLRDK